MKKLLVYLKDYKLESIVGPLFKLLEACFELIVPLLVADVINNAIPNGDAAAVRRTALIMVMFGVLGLVCSITAQFFAAKAAVGFGAAVRSALFKHINTLSHAELDRLGSSGLITRLTADGKIRSCLFSDSETDLLDLLRSGASDREIALRWREGMWFKPRAHGKEDADFDIEEFAQASRSMSAIGG